MLGIVSKMKTVSGKAEEYEALVRRVAALSLEREPGCHYYCGYREQNKDNHFIVIEHYTDRAALAAHRDSEHFRQAMVDVVGLVEGAPDITFYDVI